MESLEGQKPSRVDRVFKQALREFKDNLVATYSVVNKQGPETLNIKYKDLIANFMHVSLPAFIFNTVFINSQNWQLLCYCCNCIVMNADIVLGDGNCV